MNRRRIALAAFVFSGSIACRGQGDPRNIAAKRQFMEGEAPPPPASAPPTKVGDDQRGIEAIVRMSADDANKRLGAYRLERSWVVSTDSGGRRATIKEDAKVAATKSGAIHLTFDTSDGTGFEAFWFPVLEQAGVKKPALIHRDRHGTFRLRENSASDEKRWRDWAWAPLRAVVDEFGGRIGFTRGVTESIDGRRRVRYEVALLPVRHPDSRAEGVDAPLAEALQKLALAPIDRWRDRKRAVNVRGHVSIDEATAVVTSAEIHGTLDIDPPTTGAAGKLSADGGPAASERTSERERSGSSSQDGGVITTLKVSLTRPRRVAPLEKTRLALSLKFQVRGVGADAPLMAPTFSPPFVRPRFDNERFGLLGMSKIDYFLIDRFEYPNIEGLPPKVGVAAREAQSLCKAQGKRLCTDKEFRKACNLDKTHMLYVYGSGYDPRNCNSEGNAVKAAGSHPKCRTTWNVYDLIGNVAEWTTCKDRDRDAETFCLVGGAVGDGAKGRCRTRVKIQEVKKISLAGFRCCR